MYFYLCVPLCCCLLGLLQREARRVGGRYPEQRALYVHMSTSYALGSRGARGHAACARHGHAAMGGRAGGKISSNIRTTNSTAPPRRSRRSATARSPRVQHRHHPSARNMKWAFAHGGTFRQPFTYSSSSTLRAFRVLSTSSLRSACRSGGFLVRAPSVWLLDASVTWVVHFCVVTCCLLFIRTLSRGNRACHGLVCFNTTSIQAYNACGEPVF